MCEVLAPYPAMGGVRLLRDSVFLTLAAVLGSVPGS